MDLYIVKSEMVDFMKYCIRQCQESYAHFISFCIRETYSLAKIQKYVEDYLVLICFVRIEEAQDTPLDGIERKGSKTTSENSGPYVIPRTNVLKS